MTVDSKEQILDLALADKGKGVLSKAYFDAVEAMALDYELRTWGWQDRSRWYGSLVDQPHFVQNLGWLAEKCVERVVITNNPFDTAKKRASFPLHVRVDLHDGKVYMTGWADMGVFLPWIARKTSWRGVELVLAGGIFEAQPITCKVGDQQFIEALNCYIKD